MAQKTIYICDICRKESASDDSDFLNRVVLQVPANKEQVLGICEACLTKIKEAITP